MKKRICNFWRMTGWLLLLPLLLLALLQTPPGKELLADSVSKGLSGSENLTVRMGTISGWIPGDVRIADLVIGDDQGIWLEATGLHCRWRLAELLRKRVYLDALGADQIVLHRFPKTAKSDSPPAKTKRRFRPFEVRLDGLDVERLALGKDLAGVALEYTVHSGGMAYLGDGQLAGELRVGGDAEGKVMLDAILTGRASDRLTISTELERMRNPTFGLDQLSGNAEAIISAKGVEAQVMANLGADGSVGKVSTRLHYATRKLRLQQFRFNGSGYAAEGDLSLGFAPGSIDVSLDSVCMDVSTNRYAIRGLATVATSNKTWSVDVPSLELHGWETVAFNLAGKVDPNRVALTAKLTPFDIGRLRLSGLSNFTGVVSGDIQVNGTLTDPRIAAGIQVRSFSSVQQALDELPELDFGIQGEIADGQLHAFCSLTNYASGYLTARGSMPCGFSLQPFRFKPESAGLEVHVDADLDLGLFNRMAMFQDQFIGGLFVAELEYADRTPSGYVEIVDGRYEHYDWGLVFHDFNALLDVTPDGLAVRRAAATDGDTGKVVLGGAIRRDGLDLKLGFAGADVIRRDEVDARVSGELDIVGKVLHPEIGGALTIDRAEILLDNIPAPPPLPISNFDKHATNSTSIAGRRIRKPPPFKLDIKVAMPDQVFVNASMIEAVLGGNIHISDAPKGIALRGTIEPRRGFVNFIGKKFRFTGGKVLLDGNIPTMAHLDNLAAEYTRHDVTARLVLNGPANDPRFRLESTPAMPEDEVLSHVLFGRDTSSISPYQAYQIAAAARQLSGGLNGPGFMYQIRQAVGVDTLEWREADVEGGASSVAAGKYIASGLYIEVNRSLDAAGQTGMMAEFEVTPHFSLETYTGPELRPGIGANWRNDY
jgi:autotransporter translocation and assembly factor TamB